ncbi:MAG: DUF695 domain-containing protein [Planctomycetota bacterium]
MTTEEREEIWFLAEGEIEGQPSLMRGRKDLDSLATPASHPIRLVITWFCEDPEATGLPSPSDFEKVTDFEIELSATLEEPAIAFCAFVFSYDGTVEFNFYASNLNDTVAALEATFGEEPQLPIQLASEEEPDWADYRAILSDIDNAED